MGVSRTVNVLNVDISTPDYNSTLTYVYDKASGMLLESSSTTITQAQPTPITSTYSYSIIETNIFGSSVPEFSSPIPVFAAAIVAAFVVIVLVLFVLRKRKL